MDQITPQDDTNAASVHSEGEREIWIVPQGAAPITLATARAQAHRLRERVPGRSHRAALLLAFEDTREVRHAWERERPLHSTIRRARVLARA